MACSPSLQYWQMKVHRDPLLRIFEIMVVTITGLGDNLTFTLLYLFFSSAILMIVGKRPKAIVFGVSFWDVWVALERINVPRLIWLRASLASFPGKCQYTSVWFINIYYIIRYVLYIFNFWVTIYNLYNALDIFYFSISHIIYAFCPRNMYGVCLHFVNHRLLFVFSPIHQKGKQDTRGLGKELLVYWISKEAEPPGFTTNPLLH